MIETIIEILNIIGAIFTVVEIGIIIINFSRRSKALKADRSGFTEVMSSKPSFFKTLLWAANPLNLFKTP